MLRSQQHRRLPGKVSAPVSAVRLGLVYLYCQQEEVQIEVGEGQDVFVCDGHHDGRGAIRDYWRQRALFPGDLRARRWWFRKRLPLLLSQLHVIPLEEPLLLLFSVHGES